MRQDNKIQVRLVSVSEGIFNEVGSISVGKRADFVLLDQELNIAAVYIDGKEFTC